MENLVHEVGNRRTDFTVVTNKCDTMSRISQLSSPSPVLAVVRKSRYTHSVIEQNKTFTVSVPYDGEMKGALGICGSVSARDGSDKWAKAGLEKQKAKSVDGYVVKGCKGYLECRVVTRLDMGACDLKEIGSFYADGDMHDFYFAEIMDEYYG